MKMGLFLLYGAISFILTLNVSTTLHGGVKVAERKNDATFFKFSVVGLTPEDWFRALIIGIVSGVAAGIGPVSGFWGIVACVMMIIIWGYFVIWSFFEAETPREVISFILAMAPLYFASRIGSIASGAILSGLSDVLTTIVQLAFTAGIAITIGTALFFHYHKKGEATYLYGLGGVAVVFVIIWAIILF